MKRIQVLGPGCARCIKLAEEVAAAAKELGIEAEIEKISDMDKILSYGILRTPGLVIDGVVKLSGQLPSRAELKKLLQC